MSSLFSKIFCNKDNEKIIDTFAGQNSSLCKAVINMFRDFCQANQYAISAELEEKKQRNNLAMKELSFTHLKNAKEGEEYEYIFSDKVEIVHVEFDAEKADTKYGLVFDKKKQKIHGKVELPYDNGIDLRLRTINKKNNTEDYVLHINPHPEKMWKNIPSNRNLPFWKEDAANQTLCTKDAIILAARQRGRSHAHKGSCCDDDFYCMHNKKLNCFIAAVGDGAGSCEYSRKGSKVACEVAVKSIDLALKKDGMHKLLDITEANDEKLKEQVSNIFSNALYKALSHHKRVVEKYELENIKQLSTTLLICFALPLSTDKSMMGKANTKWLICTYWIGDGALAVYGDKELDLRGKPDGGEYSGETLFLDTNAISTEGKVDYSKIAARMRISITNNPIIFMMTDGVSDPKFPSETALNNKEEWKKIIDELKTPLKQENPASHLEQYLNFWSAGEHDDRTLLMIIPEVYSSEFKLDWKKLEKEYPPVHDEKPSAEAQNTAIKQTPQSAEQTGTDPMANIAAAKSTAAPQTETNPTVDAAAQLTAASAQVTNSSRINKEAVQAENAENSEKNKAEALAAPPTEFEIEDNQPDTPADSETSAADMVKKPQSVGSTDMQNQTNNASENAEDK